MNTGSGGELLDWRLTISRLRLSAVHVYNCEVRGQTALAQGCEKKGAGYIKDLFTALIYEHPDQWVNGVKRGENGGGMDWSK